MTRPLRTGLALVAIAALASCGSAEHEALRMARSLVAEWAAVNRAETAGIATGAYAEGMREAARTQLRALAGQAPAHAAELERILALPANAPAEQLEAEARHLAEEAEGA